MCLVCGFPEIEGDWTLAGLPVETGLVLFRRDSRLEALTNLLRPYGLTVRPASFGVGVIVAASTGPEVRVGTIDALWPAVQSLTGCLIDPLDPALLDRVDV